MPSEKVLEVKKQQVAALKERIQNSCAGVIVNYEGISVADDTKYFDYSATTAAPNLLALILTPGPIVVATTQDLIY